MIKNLFWHTQNRLLWLIWLNLFYLTINSQPVIYNAYANVTVISGTSFTVNNADETNHTFAVGENVVVMQMQDDVIGTNTTNVASFGDLGSGGIKKAGLWEIAKVSSLTRSSGVLTKVVFSAALSNAYTIGANSSVQLITYRKLSTAAFTSTANITGNAWNGTNGTGGVIALEVPTVFTLGHTITADLLGFAGGVKNPTQFASTSCDATYVIAIGNKWAGKGEGIYKVSDQNLNGARGKILSGGGGGNDENSGGGGGSNYADGGTGGPGYNGSATGCSPGVGGLGGIPLNSYVSGGRIFMGGGGGGGHENNNVGTVGGKGGGIILLKTGTLTTTGSCGTVSITANGETAGDSGNDAAGGGGAGGSIIMQVQKFAIVSGCTLKLSANAGNGGNVIYGVAHGAGGGGGQGAILYSVAQPTTNMVTTTNNGTGGCNDNNSPCTSTAASSTMAAGAGIKDNVSTPLPVTLSNFTVIKSGQSALLQWTTVTEHKNSYFDMERSTDGLNFESIGKVNTQAPGGNSNSILKYSGYDNYPVYGINYYRLKQFDLDGSSECHAIVTLNQGDLIGQSDFKVYPNPSNGDVFMDLKSNDLKDLKIDLILSDLAGRQLILKRISNITTSSQLQLFEGLQKGYYILNVKTGYQDFNIKLIVN